MPDSAPSSRSSRLQTPSTPRTQASVDAAAPATKPPPLFSPWVGWLALPVLIAVGVGVWYWMRRAALRAWKDYAEEIGGEFAPKNRVAPAYVNGKIRDRAFRLETALSHDDDAPYYHTCASMPIKNGGSFILGLRRKSLLEEAQTRKTTTTPLLDDPEFERRFFVVCNDATHLPDVLTPEARRELLRYGDIEIYVRFGVIEWRRAGEQADLPALRRLTALLAQMAETIDTFPSRRLTLTERLADEALIEKGV